MTEEEVNGIFGQVIEIEVVEGAIMLRVALPLPSPKTTPLEGEAKDTNDKMLTYIKSVSKIHPGEVTIYQE